MGSDEAILMKVAFTNIKDRATKLDKELELNLVLLASATANLDFVGNQTISSRLVDELNESISLFNDFNTQVGKLKEFKTGAGGDQIDMVFWQHTQGQKLETMTNHAKSDINKTVLGCDMAAALLAVTENAENINDKPKQEMEGAEIKFDALKFHESIIKYGKKDFIRGEYTKAVNECCKAYIKYIGQVSGAGEEDGISLMSGALSEKSGIIKINELKTRSEENEQKGVMFLSMGIVAAARNPTGHEPELEWKLDEWEAINFLLLLSYLWNKVDYGIKTFGLAEDKRKITYLNSITTENREKYIAEWKKFSADFKLKVFSTALDRASLNPMPELFVFVETVLIDYPIEKYNELADIFITKFIRTGRTNYVAFNNYRYLLNKFLGTDIFRNLIIKKGYINNFIRIFSDSGSFDEAGNNARIVDRLYDALTVEQKNKVFEACATKEQIISSWAARAYIKKWIMSEKSFLESSNCTLSAEEKAELNKYIEPEEE